MNFKHKLAEVKGISRLAASIASDDLKKVRHEIGAQLECIEPEKLYETILQSYLFCGFPAVIETLRIFSELSGGFIKDSETYDKGEFESRGLKNCGRIYGRNLDKLLANMHAVSPDLKQWMIIEGYGKVMGRTGLNLLEREFVNVAILCTRYYENQLYAHIKGCLNNGASPGEVEEAFRGLAGIASARNIERSIEVLEQISGK